MNNRPLSQAQDADLRFSQAAMERAALRARELAARTGTDLVVSHNGVIEHISPAAVSPVAPPPSFSPAAAPARG